VLRSLSHVPPPPRSAVPRAAALPGDGYLWTHVYWAYDYYDQDYYWVPGTWVPAPEVGFFWTPGSGLGRVDGFTFYQCHGGPLWVFYGVINYGFGYFGVGTKVAFGTMAFLPNNTTVNRVNVEVVHNVYNTRVQKPRSTASAITSERGDQTRARAARKIGPARQRHVAPVRAGSTRACCPLRQDKWAPSTHGAPAVAATPRREREESGGVRTKRHMALQPGSSRDRASGKQYFDPAVHPNDLPRVTARSPNSGIPNRI